MQITLIGDASPAENGCIPMSCCIPNFIRNCRRGVYKNPVTMILSMFPELTFDEVVGLLQETLSYQEDGNNITFERMTN